MQSLHGFTNGDDMHERTEQLLATVERAHDWAAGQVWGGSGTRLSSTDHCRICGLRRAWFKDSQNGISSRYTFTEHGGNEIPLRDAAELAACLPEAS